MSEASTKTISLNIKELSYFNDQFVSDLTRFLKESIPQLEIKRKGNELEVDMPAQLSKRSIRLRIRKFLYKKKINDDFRPISSKEGYIVKEKKSFELDYY